MSAPVTVANSARSGGLLQRMPFGRFKGLPFAQVPEDYAAWLLKRDIDDRPRAALKGSNGSGQAASVGNRAAQPAQAGDINRVVSEFLQARREAADARRRVEEVRGRLIPLLDRNSGHWSDRASNQRVAIEEHRAGSTTRRRCTAWWTVACWRRSSSPRVCGRLSTRTSSPRG